MLLRLVKQSPLLSRYGRYDEVPPISLRSPFRSVRSLDESSTTMGGYVIRSTYGGENFLLAKESCKGISFTLETARQPATFKQGVENTIFIENLPMPPCGNCMRISVE